MICHKGCLLGLARWAAGAVNGASCEYTTRPCWLLSTFCPPLSAVGRLAQRLRVPCANLPRCSCNCGPWRLSWAAELKTSAEEHPCAAAVCAGAQLRLRGYQHACSHPGRHPQTWRPQTPVQRRSRASWTPSHSQTCQLRSCTWRWGTLKSGSGAASQMAQLQQQLLRLRLPARPPCLHLPHTWSQPCAWPPWPTKGACPLAPSCS